MYLRNLNLINFRNLIEQKIVFEKKVNIIFGDNAQGKTSILEAIHFLSIPRSFRTNSDSIALQYLKEHFDIKGNYKNSEYQNTTIRIFFSLKDGKNIFINCSNSCRTCCCSCSILLIPNDKNNSGYKRKNSCGKN